MSKQLQYDYSLMLKGSVGSKGISESKLKKLSKKMAAAHKASHALLDSGEQGFVKTIASKKDDAQLQDAVKQVAGKNAKFKQLLVIGIGGSDLGARALQSIFEAKLKGVEILFLGDTPDPVELKRVCKQIDWKHCAINPVSKSGNTVEPLSTFFYTRKLLIKAVGKAKHAKHVFVTTQDQPSLFKELVDQHGYTLIPHPQTIGGRWTVLSIVGLFSAAASGIDTSLLKKGAQAFYLNAKKNKANPAMLHAALHYLGIQQGQSLGVLMPYASNLESFGNWYRQLFAESLGKKKTRSGKTVHTGLTPLASLGPKDQHSQAQLYASGPFDKLITFIQVSTPTDVLTVPKHLAGEQGVSYLDGMRYHDILNSEQEATALALASHKRPSGTIIMPSLDEHALGQLFMFFELSCVYLAELLDVNAFDQPGVEEGKLNMYALLGKEEFKKRADDLQKFKQKIKSRIA